MKKMSAKKKISHNNPEAIKNLRKIPGVGPSIANDLIQIGIRSIDELRGKDPYRLYDKSNSHAGCIQDRCLLYVFREAVYYAETPEPKRDPEKLKWWNWKD
jgi:nucleotidyltransferase/DNA polymerase involved in DNA repair